MKLHTRERDYYVLEIKTDPVLAGDWEASFNDGTTWHSGTPGTGNRWSWLLAGPEFDAADVSMDPTPTVAVIAAACVPLLRIADNPVLDVEYGPKITLY